MDLRRDDFPVTLQAYDVRDAKENFVAEQMVSTQSEADNFMSLYAGRLIKTRDVRPVETSSYNVNRKRAAISPVLVFVLLLVVLVVVGFVTGWIPDMISKYS